jgi:hypothetical protein
MRTFVNQAAQGDVHILREKIPSNAVMVEPNANGYYIVGHSETGHHHVINSKDAVVFNVPGKGPFLFVHVEKEAVLEHQRAYDKHEALSIPPGDFKIRNQQEYINEAWQRTQD